MGAHLRWSVAGVAEVVGHAAGTPRRSGGRGGMGAGGMERRSGGAGGTAEKKRMGGTRLRRVSTLEIGDWTTVWKKSGDEICRLA